MTKAEPLKPQAMLAQADKFLRELYPRLGSNNNLLSPILADFGNYLLASHASSGSPLADMIRRLLHSHPDKLLKKEAEALLHKYYYDTRSAADQELSEGIAKLGEEALGSVASQEEARPGFPIDKTDDWEERQDRARQEAAQPIPSIADVSDRNPNDPSCKACGSAMGWKCLSCGSTLEPTQEAAMPLEQFIKENADFGPLMPSDIQGIARLIRKYEAGTPAKE